MFYMPRNRIAIKDGISPTVITSCASDFGCSTLWITEEKPMEKVMLKRGYEIEIQRERESTDRIDYVGNYSKSNFNQTPVIGKNGIAPTVTENHGQVAAIPIINATKQGYILAYVGDGVDLETRKGRRGRVQKGMSQTINTSDNKGVVVPTEPTLLGGIGEKDSNSNTQWKQQNRIYSSSSSSSAVTTSFQPYYYNLRIRKLTPRECARLQGIKDEDFDRIAKNQSNSSLYHLFGDSISTNVLVAIYYRLFKDSIQRDYKEIMESLADSVCERKEENEQRPDGKVLQ